MHTILAVSDFEVHLVGLQEEPLGGRRRAALLVQGEEAQIWSCFLLILTNAISPGPLVSHEIRSVRIKGINVCKPNR